LKEYRRERWKDILMNTHSLEAGTAAHHTGMETEALTKEGFAQDEVASLLRLRQWYQNGGSDRVNVVRHLEFLKFLVMRGKLDA
jgi:hypothetical protein